MNQWKQSLLQFLRSPDLVKLKNQLRVIWYELLPEEKTKIYQFFSQANLNKLFFYFLSVDLKYKSQHLPWLKLLSMLNRSQIDLPEDQLKELSSFLKKMGLISSEAESIDQLKIQMERKQKEQFFVALSLKKMSYSNP